MGKKSIHRFKKLATHKVDQFTGRVHRLLWIGSILLVLGLMFDLASETDVHAHRRLARKKKTDIGQDLRDGKKKTEAPLESFEEVGYKKVECKMMTEKKGGTITEDSVHVFEVQYTISNWQNQHCFIRKADGLPDGKLRFTIIFCQQLMNKQTKEKTYRISKSGSISLANIKLHEGLCGHNSFSPALTSMFYPLKNKWWVKIGTIYFRRRGYHKKSPIKHLETKFGKTLMELANELPKGWEETVVDDKPFYQYYVNKSGQPWPRDPTSADGEKVPRGERTTRPSDWFPDQDGPWVCPECAQVCPGSFINLICQECGPKSALRELRPAPTIVD